MSAAEKLRRTASQMLSHGVDPYNTAVELERQRQQLADFAEWVAGTREEETPGLLSRQAE